MARDDETKRPDPDAAAVERTVSRQAEQVSADEPAGKARAGKADEGTRPGDLTSENDGGAEG